MYEHWPLVKCSSGKHWVNNEDEAKRCCNGWVQVRVPIVPGASTDGVWFVKLVPEADLLKGFNEKDVPDILGLIRNTTGTLKH